MKTKRFWILALALATVPACKRDDDQRTDTIDPSHVLQDRESLPPEVVAQVDSGTQAYRVHDMDAALRHYTRATQLEPDLAAGWFGVYMVESALGHEASADEALKRAQQVVPGATLIRPERQEDTP